MLRKLLNEILCGELRSHLSEGEQPAVSFSAGTDSLCLLWVLLDLGYKPALYIYGVEGYPSQDVRRAAWISRVYGLVLKRYLIPSDPECVLKDIRRIIGDGIRGKVNIQCLHGHYYIAPHVAERVILHGGGIDALYGSYREFTAWSEAKKDKAVFDRLRRQHLANPNDDGMEYLDRLYAWHGVKVVFPYRYLAIVDYLMGFTWERINKPRQKQIIVKEFPEILSVKGLYRPRGSQQIVAGVRALHDTLLERPTNGQNPKRIETLYRAIEHGEV